ncbi:MAG: ABC transporter ATP-binding protein, partial [Eubacterium sp.]|nr:ABC transporter ATP-binding protein [Eubacterium sp.]
FDEFKQNGKTILFVSHDLSSISRYCDRVILMHKGEKLAEGTPKDMVDLYKKLLTGSDKDQEEAEKQAAGEGNPDASEEAKSEQTASDGPAIRFSDTHGTNWKSHFNINPNVSEYGDRTAEIVDFAVIDEAGRLTDTLIKGSPFTIRYRVFFHERVKDPIFTFTFKTTRGTDVTGTNTMIEKDIVQEALPGELYEVSFSQVMSMQGGDYLLSISCTGFENGNLKAHHRLYDLIDITVISDKNTVGFYDMDSETSVKKADPVSETE